MIPLFLKAKHWQLFVLMIAIPMGVQILGLTSMFSTIKESTSANPQEAFTFFNIFPITTLLFAGIFFGWFWSITIGLQNRVPNEFKIKVTRFKILFLIPAIYLLVLMLYISTVFSGFGSNILPDTPWIALIIVPLHLLSMFGIFHSMYCAAKTIKTLELKRQVNFGDFAGEFFLLWFYFIGIWIIQPKVNTLFKMNNSSKNI